MVTNSRIAAFGPRPSIPTVLRRAVPSQSESRLERLASRSCSVAEAYRGESRPWWDLVDDERVYEAIADTAFEDYVLIAGLGADGYSE